MPSNSNAFQKGIVVLIFIGIFVLSFLILKPVLVSIVLALISAYFFHPIHKKINSKIKIPTLSTLILILILLIVVAIPLIYLTPEVIDQTFEVYSFIQGIDLTETFNEFLSRFLDKESITLLSLNIESLTGKFFSSTLNQFTNLLINLPNFILQLAVFLFTFFFAVKDADKLKSYIRELSPFSKSTEEKFMAEFRHVTDGIIYGNFIVGIIQGVLLGIGLYVLGIPNTLFLTAIAIIFSIIPIVGPWLIWVPVSAYLFFTGNLAGGIILSLYGALFISTVDNILRPLFLSRYSKLPISISVIGFIGGLYFFGIIGLVLGPLTLAYLLIIIEFYRQGKLNEVFK